MAESIEDGTNIYRPWKEDSKDSRLFVSELDQDAVIRTWGCLYCGGQGHLVDCLKKTAKEFGIPIVLESFKW